MVFKKLVVKYMHKKQSIVKHKDHEGVQRQHRYLHDSFSACMILITYAVMFQIRFSILSYIWTQIERLYEKYIVHYQTHGFSW